ncbi:MAG TPA: Do family serine endopeptidase [Candidatus Binatia bacterium]|nr:Do family serine endopeptidase [Candidatus Binatia bacterium]
MESRETVRAAKVLLVAGGLLLIGIVVGFILAGGSNSSPVLQAKESVVSSGLESPFTAIAERTLPGVVSIETKRNATGSDGPYSQFEGPYGDFFRRLFPETPQQPQQQRRNIRIPSSGSGFIIDRAGYILTNNHVVRDAAEITVTLNDHRKFKARVVGTDPGTDVAVIKVVGAGDLPVVPLGDSDEIRIGDWAIAIGNALGELDGTLTVGVISAKGRTNLAIQGGAPSYQNFIQTDASINFGNSGGPLLNIRGEAIGINTAVNPSGEGIGFAIPINIASSISKQLIATGKVTRGYLGILPQELTPELADNWGIQGHGVLVGGVSSNTPASQAGFQVKDVITDFDGKAVDDVQRFRLLVAETPVNKKVAVRVLRNGKPRDLAVTLAERPPEDQVAKADNATPSTASDWLGIQVSALGSDAAGEFNLHDKTGVVITDVTEGSGADDSGLRPGDVVKEVNDIPVKDMMEYTHAVEAAKRKNPAKPVVFLIKRGDATQFVAVEPSQD